MEFRDGYAEFAPQFETSLDEAVELITNAIEHCYAAKQRKLLCNIIGLTGFEPPTVAERYWFVNEWAAAGHSHVILAMVAPERLIDPDKIGVTMARNAGMRANVFLTDEEAVEWLKDQ